MKLIQESIFEGPSFEEILERLGLSKDSDPNEMLIKGLEERAYPVVQHALDSGANQLWWETGGPQGGHRGLNVPYITDSIVVIKKLKGKKPANRKIVFQEIWHTYDGHLGENGPIRSTGMFLSKFEPVSIKTLDKTIETVNEIKKLYNDYMK